MRTSPLSIDTSGKPPILYHGSPYRFREALPSFATPITDKACRRGIYASPDRRIGLAFALQYRSFESGCVRRARLWCDRGEVFLAVTADSIDWDANSFLYHLPSSAFVAVNDWEWMSPEPVVPVRCETVSVRNFLRVVYMLGDEAVCTIGEHFRNPPSSGVDAHESIGAFIA